jgi:hypothetical protein
MSMPGEFSSATTQLSFMLNRVSPRPLPKRTLR